MPGSFSYANIWYMEKELYELITTRHSCRKFAKRKVPQKSIDKILECGLCAPSAMNKQPWHFVIVDKKSKIEEMTKLAQNAFLNSGIDWRISWAKQENFSPFYNPNVVIVVCNNKSVPNSRNDCCFALMNMTLMAQCMGISSCIIQDACWAIDEYNKKDFGILEGFSVCYALSVGYPKTENRSKKVIDKSKISII